MTVAVARLRSHYRDDKKIAGNLALLRSYLQSHYDAQPLLNKVATLWAAARMPGLLDGRAED